MTLILSLIFNVYAAQSGPSALTTLEKGKVRQVKLQKIKESNFVNCKASKCIAVKTFSGPKRDLASKAPKSQASKGGVHPASQYCKLVGGLSQILKDKKYNEYDYCLFEDGSMVDSWQLYKAHHSVGV